jgi:RNA recognition motif-containing protein
MKLFVSGFSKTARLSEVAGLFEGCGKVVSARLKQGEKRPYAIIEMADFDAERAIEKLNGTEWNYERLEVSESWW